MPVYDKFQLIAYHVPTDSSPTAEGPYTGGQLLTAQRIDELKVDLNGEPLNQLTRLVGAVELAKGAASLGDDNVLKVFVVPEFYFRPQNDGPPRAYTVKQRDSLLAALKEVFCKAAFEHWLFIFGTVVWKEVPKNIVGMDVVNNLQQAANNAPNKEAKRQLGSDVNFLKYGAVVWNTALILVGGEELHCLDKTVYADADAIPIKYHPDVDAQDGYGRYPEAVTVPLKTYFDNRALSASRRILEVKGLGWFGAEICMEHQSGVLKKVHEDWRKALGDFAPELAFQVLTACGMCIHPGSVVVEAKRFILKVDGASFPFHEEPRSELQCVMSRDDGLNGAGAVTCESHKDDHKNTWDAVNQHADPPAFLPALKFNVRAGVDVQPFAQELVFFKEQPFEYAAPAQQQQQQEANAQVQ